MTDPESAAAAAPDASPDAGQQFYTTAGRLDHALWAAGYRLCAPCGGLTIHRLTCLRCDPTGASRIEREPREGAA